jgi:hypothetical protein
MRKFLLVVTIIFSLKGLAQQDQSSFKLSQNCSVNAVVDSFISTKHKYDTCDTGLGWKMICLIDGKFWFGLDDGMELPKNQLKRLVVLLDKKQIDLDVSGMFNPTFSGTLRKEQFKLEKFNDGYMLYGFFSDGAGTYTAHWKIVKGKSFRTVISRDENDFYWQQKR